MCILVGTRLLALVLVWAGCATSHKERGAAALTFPWRTPHLLARDERLVQLIREGGFDALLPGDEGRAWASRVVAAHQRLS